jgi:outer membrane receptor protein involved in Fe transport
MRRLFGIAMVLIAALVLIGTSVFAQTETGSISGTITDPSGAIVQGAKITVKNITTNAIRNTATNSAGNFTVTNLPPAEYTVTVEAPGFGTKSRNAKVDVGTRVPVDIQLAVSGVAETVTVSAEAVAVNTESQTLSSIVSTQQIVELPTLTRNPYALVGTAGNVSGTTPDNRGVGFSINGQRAASTNVLLDGAANNDEFGAGIGQAVPLDSVQEFSVLTNNFTAEFGRASGGIVNVATKSGSNEFHGTAYDFNRVSAMASNDFNSNANDQPKGTFVRNQFGYSFGGPVLKDKLFFFSSTEWTRVRSSANNFAFVPTSQLLGLSDTNTQKFFQTYGAIASGVTTLNTVSKADLLAQGVDLCKGLASTSKCVGIGSTVPLFTRVNYVVPQDSGGGSPQNTYSTVNRIDYNLSDRTQLYFRYALSSEDDFAGTMSASPYSGYNTPNTQFNNSAVFSVTRTFSPTLVNQLKINFNRFNNQQPLSEKGVVPTLYMNSSGTASFPGGDIAFPGYYPYTPGSGGAFGGPQNYLQLYEDLSWAKGKHEFRFGGSYNYLRDNRTFGAYQTAGEYLNTTSGIPKSFENFLQGQLNSMTVAVDPQGKFPCGAVKDASCTLTLPVGSPNFSRSNRYNDWSLYAQDAYRITNRLTLNLGVRWEVFGTQHNKDPYLDSNYYLGTGASIYAQIANGNLQLAPNSPEGKLWHTNYGNFAPRIGFAYDLTGKGRTSVRGGYGIGYERNFGNVTFNVIQNPPNYASVSITAPTDFPAIPISTDNLGILAGSSGTKALPPTTLRAVDPNMKTAYAHLYSLALEHRIGESIITAVEYSGSSGENQYGISNVNRIGYGNFYNGIPCTPGTGGDPGTCTARTRTTQYTSINFRTNGGSSSYNAMNLRFEVHGKYGLNLRTNYTWAHTIDDLSDTFNSSGSVNALGWLVPTDPSVDRGDSYSDARHRFAISGTWDIGLKKAAGWQKQLLNGWSIAPILTITSGTPFSIFDCTNGYNVCPYGFAKKIAPTSGDGLVATSTPNTYNYLNMANYFDSSWYDPKTGVSDIGTFPSNMVRRNSFRGPGSWTMDMGIYKKFYLTEKYSLQLRAEGYNFFNHPNLNNPNAQDFSSGDYVTTGYSGRRFFQMALKFIF